jgi:glycosyltransferase involved in cell wall biosynthesis
MNRRILVLEPFHGGSHRAFLEQWEANCDLDFTIIGLPDKFWRWRTRHAAIYFADKLNSFSPEKLNFDLIFCSSMLNLPEFRGLAPSALRNLPAVVYFHENQLVYPIHDANKRDQNTILVNFKSALAAEQVWFNSAYNRDTFLNQLPEFFERMPDNKPLAAIETIRDKSKIFPPGIETPLKQNIKSNSPRHILWAARWEDDKNPKDFFRALHMLRKNKIDFRLSVIGEKASRVPESFANAKKEFADQIINWGYADSRRKYLEILADADIIVSTAIHEFFGISVVEAIAAGAYPLLPKRLAYPEVLALEEHPERECFFYNETAGDLGEKLLKCCSAENDLWLKAPAKPEELVSQYYWENAAQNMVDQILKV